MANVQELNPSERVVLDTAQLDRLFRRLGERGAEAAVMDAVEDISDRLAAIERHFRSGALSEVPEQARCVSQRCAEIGLTSLARVARDLGITAARRDMIAFRAIWERLVRIGDRSLAQIWEMPGLSL